MKRGNITKRLQDCYNSSNHNFILYKHGVVDIPKREYFKQDSFRELHLYKVRWSELYGWKITKEILDFDKEKYKEYLKKLKLWRNPTTHKALSC